jgi:hypothetical protein
MAAHRKLTNVMNLSGAIDRNPKRHADRANNPETNGPLGPPPSGFTDDECAAWNEIVSTVAEGVLCRSDRTGLEIAAKCFNLARGGDFAAMREWRMWCPRFGLTPADRTHVAVPNAKPKKSRFEV